MVDAAAAIPGLAPPGEAQKRQQVKQTAQNFEASFLSVMMQSMWQGVGDKDAFSGGEGEKMFRSLLSDSMSKQVAKTGGLGLAASVEREMLKMQGLQ